GVEDIILQCRFVVLAFLATHRQFFVTTRRQLRIVIRGGFLYVTVFMNRCKRLALAQAQVEPLSIFCQCFSGLRHFLGQEWGRANAKVHTSLKIGLLVVRLHNQGRRARKDAQTKEENCPKLPPHYCWTGARHCGASASSLRYSLRNRK